MLRRLAFAVSAVFVASVAGGGSAVATPPGPNGQLAVAFNSGLAVMNPDGSGITRLFEGGGFLVRDVAWSPDGSRIAFTHGSNGEGSNNGDIAIVDAAGGNLQVIERLGSQRQPTWSPDGTRIAYTQGVDSGSAIWVMNADGSDAARVTSDSARSEQPDWSPQGERLLYTRGGRYSFESPAEIYAINSDGTGQARLTDDDALNYGRPDSFARWSPDGSKIAWTRADAGTSVWTMAADGTGKQRVTQFGMGDSEYYPAWSPAGDRIAFARSRQDLYEQGQMEVWTIAATGGDLRQLTCVPSGAMDIDWSSVQTPLAGGGSCEPVDSASASLSEPGEVRTNPIATVYDPLSTTVSSRLATDVSIQETAGAGTVAPGYTAIPWHVDVTTAEEATADLPHNFGFVLDRSLLASSGIDSNDISVFRNGARVAHCDGQEGIAAPDPCHHGWSLWSGSLEDASLWMLASDATGRWSFGYLTDPPNADGDLIDDAIEDPDRRLGFVDTTTDPDTVGYIDWPEEQGLRSVLVSDAPAPEGVRIRAASDEEYGEAYDVPFVICGHNVTVYRGTDAVFTCGSVRMKVRSGQVRVAAADGSAAVTVPAGADARLSGDLDAAFTVQNFGTVPVTVTVGGVTSSVGPGETKTVTPLTFVGFAAPVDNGGVLNRVKAGQAVPLKWRLLNADGTPMTTLTAVTVTAETLSCATGTTEDQLEELASGRSGLLNLGNGYYQFNWQTPKTYAGSCKRVRVDVGGLKPEALFKFTR